MHASPLRVRDIAVTVILGAGIGLMLGYAWGRAVTLRTGEEMLERFAERILAEDETARTQARAVLHKLNQSSFTPCSHQEIQFFRSFMYGAQYLKDAGRMEDGRIECSALLSRLPASADRYDGAFVHPDGARVYRDLPPYRIPGQTSVTVQLGGSMVVYNPFNLRPLESPPMHFAIFDRDQNTGKTRYLLGDAPEAATRLSIFDSDGTRRFGDSLYATRCAEERSACMTAYMSRADALQAGKGQFRIYIGLSGLCGALFALVLFLTYRRTRSVDRQLRRALRRDALEVAYQPIYDLQSGRPIAAEALARWTDESGAPVSPDVFIKLAEDRGFVGEITRCMVYRALHAWKHIARIDPDFRINVNITAADLHDEEFLPMISQALAHTGVPPRALAFEITESSSARWQSAESVLASLAAAGHLVELDDFGTGYSSLAYLNHLPLDVLKVDKEFTQSIGTESVKISLVPQILSLAAALHLSVVVEGVETEEQARYFAECQPPVMAQGWYFGRPMPLEELTQLLRRQETIHIPPATQSEPAQYEI